MYIDLIISTIVGEEVCGGDLVSSNIFYTNRELSVGDCIVCKLFKKRKKSYFECKTDEFSANKSISIFQYKNN